MSMNSLFCGTMFCQVINQYKGGTAGWFDNRGKGRGVVGTLIGAYSVGGTHNRPDTTLVLVVRKEDGNRTEVHWHNVPEAYDVAYWVSLVVHVPDIEASRNPEEYGWNDNDRDGARYIWWWCTNHDGVTSDNVSVDMLPANVYWLDYGPHRYGNFLY